MAQAILPDGSKLEIADGSSLKQLAEKIGPGLAKAALAAGADGLIVEVHTDPENAFVDGRHTLTCKAFADLMTELRPIAEAVGRKMNRSSR